MTLIPAPNPSPRQNNCMGLPYHSQSAKEALEDLQSSLEGLSPAFAEELLRKHGPNEIKEKAPISPLKIFLKQFDSIVIWILIVATIISTFLGEIVDSLVIGIILVLIAVLGFVQEYRTEKAIEALKKMASLRATILRGGKKLEIDAKTLVPGDILLVESGNKVGADARILESANLKTQEAALTGESQPVCKNSEPLPEKITLAEMSNMLHSGTLVVNGKGKAVITSTGMETEIGKIATLLEETKPEPTPLKRKMDKLGKQIGMVVLFIAFLIFTLQLVRTDISWLENLKTSVAVAVAAIPEGLAAVVTLSLALGTQRMLKRHALVRSLPSVETLGSTTVICTDKTGTLTKNEMMVKKLYVPGKTIDVTGSGYSPHGQFLSSGKPTDPEEISHLLMLGALNNDAELHEEGIFGDPTEGALLVCAAKAGFSKKELEFSHPRIEEIEFTSERKLMTTIHDVHGEKIAYVKGAPEIILGLCSYIQDGDSLRKLTSEDWSLIVATNRQFADDALRVIGFAYRRLQPGVPKDAVEKNLVFVGMQGMMDPAREEVHEAIGKCRDAGIKVVMITGDQEITAKAVAREIGIIGKSMTGAKLDAIDALDEIVEEYGIFARVNPEHKLKIVDALKKKGHIVAMTGDGVNDAPALKRADIGVAMGITGTDVSKEASAIILTDDNFASIVNAVEEGRGTYDNIRKYFAFLLSGNIAEVLIIFLGIIFGLPLPLTATQILLINLVTDGLPALALSADPFEPHAMSRKPRKKTEPIHKGLFPYLITYPFILTITALSVFSYFYFQEGNLLKAQTATFLTISLSELYQAITCRSTIYPIWKVGLLKNKYLVLAVLASFSVIATSLFIPSIGQFLDMAPLGPTEFLSIALLASGGGIAIEISKTFKLKRGAP